MTGVLALIIVTHGFFSIVTFVNCKYVCCFYFFPNNERNPFDSFDVKLLPLCSILSSCAFADLYSSLPSSEASQTD